MTPTVGASSIDASAAQDTRRSGLVLALGLAVAAQGLLAFVYGPAAVTTRDSWSVALGVCILLSLPSAWVIWAVLRAQELPADWRLCMVIAVAGIIMRAPYVGIGPMLEDDHFRYLLDGAMVAHGLSPYAQTPEALLSGAARVPPEIVEAGRSVIAAINFPELRSMYPGGAQALFALAHLIAPWKIDGLRIVIFVFEAASTLLIWRLLAASNHSPLLAALYWCNPLMAFCLTGQAHIDAALAAPILLALLAAHARAGALAGIALGVAAGIKLWPILLAPLLVRMLWPDRRSLAVFAAALASVTAVLCAPLMWASLSADAGLTAYAGGWSVNNAPYSWASIAFLHAVGPGVGEMLLRALVVLAAVTASLVVAAPRPASLEAMVGRAAILAAALFYLSPAQFPWYAAWFVPLAAASGSWVLVAASVGLPVYYLFFPLAAQGLRDVHGYGLAFLHLAPVLLAAVIMHRRPRSGASA